MYKEIRKCRICGNKNLVSVMNLGKQAMTGIFPENSTVRVDEAPLEIVKCMGEENGKTCGLVQLKHTYSLSDMYGNNYGYRSGLNQSMVKHLQKIVNKIESTVELKKGDLVVDIGSNDSTLLSSYTIEGIDLVGIDPTGMKFLEYYPSWIRLNPTFFSNKAFECVANGKKAKVITSIAMFYDLENPIIFAKDVYKSLDDEGIWLLEQSYLPTMIEANAYDTICHEHLEFYGLAQIKWIMDSVGFRIIEVELNNSNGGSFSVTAVKKAAKLLSDGSCERMLFNEEKNGYKTIEPFKDFVKRVEKNKKELIKFIRGEKKKGKRIFGYGASTKGNVLLQYCGLSNEEIIAIAEVNPDKFGCITPGTQIPIISEEEVKKMNPDYLLVLPWHFKESIIEKEVDFLKAGCKLIFPLPNIEIIGE